MKTIRKSGWAINLHDSTTEGCFDDHVMMDVILNSSTRMEGLGSGHIQDLLDVLNEAKSYCEDNYGKSPETSNYLCKKQFREGSIVKFLGYGTSSRTDLTVGRLYVVNDMGGVFDNDGDNRLLSDHKFELVQL